MSPPEPRLERRLLPREEFVVLCEAAFSADPGGARSTIAMYEYFPLRPGAAGVVATDASGRTLGFAYGYPGFRWADHTSPWDDLLREALHGEDERLVDSYTVMFLAVHPHTQGRGLGRTLLRAVIPPDTSSAWLATRDAGTPAQRLYAAEGWREIGRGPLAGPGEVGVVLWRRFGE